jgi:hypothetical protein
MLVVGEPRWVAMVDRRDGGCAPCRNRWDVRLAWGRRLSGAVERWAHAGAALLNARTDRLPLRVAWSNAIETAGEIEE